MSDLLQQLQAETASLDTAGFLRHVVDRLGGDLAFATSLGAEDQVLTALLVSTGSAVPIFTIDTGRLPQETHDLIEATTRRYGVEIRVLVPPAGALEELVGRDGANGFYRSVEARRRCCGVRKVLPLRRALAGLAAWMTGLRRQQSLTREQLRRVEFDDANSIIKLNPLAEWTTQQVWDYVRQHDVPVSALHARGYPSIGCQPCTRGVAAGQDIRSGRWWWEQPEHKECGLHLSQGGAGGQDPAGRGDR